MATNVQTFTDEKTARLYQDVPGEQLEQFQQFWAAHPLKRATIDDIAWEYLVAGQGGVALLLLTGALGVLEISWWTIAHFAGWPGAGRYRVIAPVYPPVKEMDTLVDGIAGILRREGIDQAHVMGGSYGGFVAQVFVRRHPDMSASLVLSHTLPPDPTVGEGIRKASRWLSFAPMWLLRLMFGRRLGALLPEKTPDTALAHAIFEEVVRHRMTKQDLMGSLWRALDFAARCFAPQDLADWPGRVLLVMADDDPSTPEPVREGMRALYPGAEVHIFHGTGHAAALLKQDEYYEVIEQFLNREG